MKKQLQIIESDMAAIDVYFPEVAKFLETLEYDLGDLEDLIGDPAKKAKVSRFRRICKTAVEALDEFPGEEYEFSKEFL